MRLTNFERPSHWVSVIVPMKLAQQAREAADRRLAAGHHNYRGGQNPAYLKQHHHNGTMAEAAFFHWMQPEGTWVPAVGGRDHFDYDDGKTQVQIRSTHYDPPWLKCQPAHDRPQEIVVGAMTCSNMVWLYGFTLFASVVEHGEEKPGSTGGSYWALHCHHEAIEPMDMLVPAPDELPDFLM